MNVLQTPLHSLSTPEGVVLQRERDVSAEDIKYLLKTVVVRFVIADVGHPLRWIPEAEKFRFWKCEVLPHVADALRKNLEDYPDEYFYRTAVWRSDSANEVVVALEKNH